MSILDWFNCFPISYGFRVLKRYSMVVSMLASRWYLAKNNWTNFENLKTQNKHPVYIKNHFVRVQIWTTTRDPCGKIIIIILSFLLSFFFIIVRFIKALTPKKSTLDAGKKNRPYKPLLIEIATLNLFIESKFQRLISNIEKLDNLDQFLVLKMMLQPICRFRHFLT